MHSVEDNETTNEAQMDVTEKPETVLNVDQLLCNPFTYESFNFQYIIDLQKY